MKAAVLEDWKTLHVRELPDPTPGAEECVVRVQCTGICGSDAHIYAGHHPTAVRPLVMGHEFMGKVEAIHSRERTDLMPGDRVVVWPLLTCGRCRACRDGFRHVCRELKVLGVHADGGFAERVKVPVANVIRIPDGLSDAAAALVEPFAVGLHVNRRAGLREGDAVLIIGGGPIGFISGLVARWLGAEKVVFSEINPARVAQLEGHGFTVLNPTDGPVLPRAMEMTGGEGFPLVYEISGSRPGVLLATGACGVRGTLCLVGFMEGRPEFDCVACILKEITVVGSRVYTLDEFRETPGLLLGKMESGAFDPGMLIGDRRPLKDLDASLQAMMAGELPMKRLISFGVETVGV
ncbi:MAG: hypothetical protein EA425_16695 [Puniceicoccaceae bacterium]|nr:MAG: hypothetical protein EA425_16695 [Puniceicoccaceae bacterium]